MFSKISKPKKIIYLDHAATTPLLPQVKKAMDPFWAEKFGNPSSLYQKGTQARQAMEGARKTITSLINARTGEIIFTAGGTESVNLAIFGVARNYSNTAKKQHQLIASAIEHHSVINSFEALKAEGFKTTLVAVDTKGFINIDKLKATIRPETIFISVMLANNEVGTIEPVAEIGRWLKGENQSRKKKNWPKIIFHTDACQAAGFLDLNVEKLGVDLMSFNASKIYGPKQSGVLYVRSGTKLKPLIYGGGQERDLRSGTENVAGIVGLATAFEIAQKNFKIENRRLTKLRDYLIRGIIKKIPKIILNGPQTISLNNFQCLPNNINLTIAGVEGEVLMFYLDAYGICASTASACSTGSLDPSHVLLAMGRNKTEAQSSIRFSLGHENTKHDVDYVLKVLTGIVKELRKIKILK